MKVTPLGLGMQPRIEEEILTTIVCARSDNLIR